MNAIAVFESGREMSFTFDSLLMYHGREFPGGVVHAFKAMQRAFPLLDEGRPPERREIGVLTAFSGPGGRDAIEMVTRAVTGGRFEVDKSMGGRDVISDPPGPYWFRFIHRTTVVTVAIRPGHVREEFVRLGQMTDRSPALESRLEELKQEMADRLLPLPAHEIYDLV